MKTYLVTGGAGFIGSNFILYMLNKYKDIKIINLDKLTYAGNLENLKSIENDNRYTFIKVDICDKGLGFPQEILTMQGSEFISTKGEQGMGIGLFLANATLERLGGDVVFLPREGGGVIARVILPIHSSATDDR